MFTRSKSKAAAEDQGEAWSRHSTKYAELFLDPFRPGVVNPILGVLEEIPGREKKAIIDLGCGPGALLPWLLERYKTVLALDFAWGMLERSKERLGPDADRVRMLHRPMHQLDDFPKTFDAAVAFNSLVMPDTREIDRTLAAIRASLKPKGVFVGILPAMDAIHYHTMLLHELALGRGMTEAEAERYAAQEGEHRYYDFAFGRFRFKGLHQKFWHPFEVDHRFRKAGFRTVERHRVLYPWDEQLVGYQDFAQMPPSWDWGFVARP